MTDGLSRPVPKTAALRVIVAAAVALAPVPAQAESLLQALASAYATNPVLNAERAALRATDEDVPRARSRFRPTVTGNAEAGYRFTRTRRDPFATSTFGTDSGTPATGRRVTRDETAPKSYGVQITQNVFNGFQNINAVREAEAGVSAGRETLRAVEQTVLLDAVTAYMDVVRDQAIVRLRENNVRVLSEQLSATRDRFDVGEVTRTDVAQSQAAHAAAQSALQLAQANLKASRAVYERIVGHPPAALSDPGPIERLLPSTLHDALYAGDSENPNVLAAVFQEQASAFAVKRIIGELLPSLNLEGSYNNAFDTSSSIEESETLAIFARLNVPLYQRGEVAARVRQAKDLNLQRRRDIDQARVQTRADIIAAWGRLTAARAQLQSDRSQVEAARVALTGVREEEKVGQRTVLDVLDAEQALLDAEVSFVATRRDLVVASYFLVASVGRLDALTLGLHVDYYDPTAHYERVKSKWWGLNAEPDPHGFHHPR